MARNLRSAADVAFASSRQKHEEEEALRLAAEFAAAHSGSRQSFVRGGSFNPTAPAATTSTAVGSASGSGKISSKPASAAAVYNPLASTGAAAKSGGGLFAADDDDGPVQKKPVNAKKRSNMDIFLEEMKRDQDRRDAKRANSSAAPPPSAAASSSSSSSSASSATSTLATGGASAVHMPAGIGSGVPTSLHPVLLAAGGAGALDPTTTNVYLGNMTTDVTVRNGLRVLPTSV